MAYNDQMRDLINIDVSNGDAELPDVSVITRMFGGDLEGDVRRIQQNIRSIPAKTGQNAARMAQTYQRTGIAAVNAICTGNLYGSITITGGVHGDSATFEVGTSSDKKGYYFALNGRAAIDLTGTNRWMHFRPKCRGRWVVTQRVGEAAPRDWMRYSRDHMEREFVHMINEAIGNAFQ